MVLGCSGVPVPPRPLSEMAPNEAHGAEPFVAASPEHASFILTSLLGRNCVSSFSEEAELLLRLKWTAQLTVCLPTDTCQCLCRLSIKPAK